MKVVVCDDDRGFCQKESVTIKKVFEQYFEGEDCQIDVYFEGSKLLQAYPDNMYDMIFLDLELEDEDGFDIAEKLILLNKNAIIIFVTSHDNLVYEAFQFRP